MSAKDHFKTIVSPIIPPEPSLADPRDIRRMRERINILEEKVETLITETSLLRSLVTTLKDAIKDILTSIRQ